MKNLMNYYYSLSKKFILNINLIAIIITLTNFLTLSNPIIQLNIVFITCLMNFIIIILPLIGIITNFEHTILISFPYTRKDIFKSFLLISLLISIINMLYFLTLSITFNTKTILILTPIAFILMYQFIIALIFFFYTIYKINKLIIKIFFGVIAYILEVLVITFFIILSTDPIGSPFLQLISIPILLITILITYKRFMKIDFAQNSLFDFIGLYGGISNDD